MESPEANRGIGASAFPMLDKVPVLARYARARGWYYVIGWLHRITGIGLVIALTVHLYIRASLQTPAASDAGMIVFSWPIFGFLVWVSSLGLGFHALNGGRVILYELFGKRNDAALLRWTIGLSIVYALLFIPIMTAKSPGIPGAFFWWAVLLVGVAMAYAVTERIGRSRHSLLWKLQRISGAFLFIAAPAYLFLSHLNPGVGGAAGSAAFQSPDVSVRIILFALAVAAIYHAGYGLFSIVCDYVSAGLARRRMITLIVAAIIALLYWACRVTLLGA